MANFYSATCARMGSDYKKHNKIADRFNNSASIRSWISPQDGHYLIKTTNNIELGDLRDMIRNAADITVFVTPFNPNNFAYSIRSKDAHKVDQWLERYQKEQQKIHKIKANGILNLSGEFQNQTIKLENGCQIKISENGEIHVEEAGKKPFKVRNKNGDVGKLIV